MSQANEISKLQEDMDRLKTEIQALTNQFMTYATQFGKLVGTNSDFELVAERLDDWATQLRSTLKSIESKTVDVTSRIREAVVADDSIEKGAIELGVEHNFVRGVFWGLTGIFGSFLGENQENVRPLEIAKEYGQMCIDVDHNQDEFDFIR